MTPKKAPKNVEPVRTPYSVDLLPALGVEGAYHHNTKHTYMGGKDTMVAVQPFLYRKGYAMARVDLEPNGDLYVYTRREGDTFGWTRTVDYRRVWRWDVCRTEAEAIAIIADALGTGRTVECGRGVGLRQMMREQHWQKSGVDMPWESILAHVEGRAYLDTKIKELPWDLNPDYQRGAVWTERQQALYIGHHLMGGQVFPVYVQRDSTYLKNEPEEVIDGQQRIRAICAFLRGQIPARFLHDGEWVEIRYLDLTEGEQSAASMSSKVVFLDLPRAERLRFYLGANSGGTPHSEADLKKVAELLAKEGAK